ncbi:MAG: hypothetical protein ABIT05_01375 [Chitinophagaceae bacterium]
MGLHHSTLKAAKNKYGPLLSEGKTETEIKEAIAADEKGYDEAGVAEIFAAIVDSDSEDQSNGGDDASKVHTVVYQFRDKADQKIYNSGDEYTSGDPKRISHLVKAGVIKEK